MRLQSKSLSRVSLIDLLRRKKTDLKTFLEGNGITTYPLLKSRCDSMGVSVPSEQEFNDARGNPVTPDVSSPTEGVIVVYSSSSPSQGEKYATQDQMDPESSALPSVPSKKKNNKKSESSDEC